MTNAEINPVDRGFAGHHRLIAGHGQGKGQGHRQCHITNGQVAAGNVLIDVQPFVNHGGDESCGRKLGGIEPIRHRQVFGAIGAVGINAVEVDGDHGLAARQVGRVEQDIAVEFTKFTIERRPHLDPFEADGAGPVALDDRPYRRSTLSKGRDRESEGE